MGKFTLKSFIVLVPGLFRDEEKRVTAESSFRLKQYLWVRPGVYPKVENLKAAPIEQGVTPMQESNCL